MHSRLKIFPMMLLVLLCISLYYYLFSVIYLIPNIKIKEITFLELLLFLFLIFSIRIFFTTFKYIVLKEDYIIVVYLMLPIFHQKIYWKEIQHVIPVTMYGKYNAYRSLWIIKNYKLKLIISSYYYKNYDEMREFLNSKIKISKNPQLNSLQQMLATLGFRIKSDL